MKSGLRLSEASPASNLDRDLVAPFAEVGRAMTMMIVGTRQPSAVAAARASRAPGSEKSSASGRDASASVKRIVARP